MSNNSKERLFEVMGKVDNTFKPKLNEWNENNNPSGCLPYSAQINSSNTNTTNDEPVDEATKEQQYSVNPKYTHFAVLKNNLIVNGWDYNGYDQEELNSDKRHYFLDDIKDMQINPRDIRIITTKRLQKMGINPFDFKYWNKDNSVFTLDETNNTNDINIDNQAVFIGGEIYNDVLEIINSKINDELIHKIYANKNADIFFNFYKKILDSIMSRIYENYSDTFTNAGSAPDELE